MIKKYKFLLGSSLVVLVGLCTLIRLNASEPSQEPMRKPQKEEFILQLVTYILSEWHYNPKPIDDSLSSAVFDGYMSTLDFGKRFFTTADVAVLEKYRYTVDNQILDGDLSFFNNSTQIFKERMRQVSSELDTLLKDPMDFTAKEYYVTEEENYPASREEMIDRWRKYLKYNILTRVYADEEIEAEKAAKDSAYKPRTHSEIEAKAREGVLKNYHDYFRRMEKLSPDDWFSMYVNSLTTYFDPHTTYMAPEEEKEFNEAMSGQMEGIGAVLQQKDGYITISSIVPGGPAAKDGNLAAGDQILEVAQGDSLYVNIVGMMLDDAVEMIRGKKGTTVRLKIQKASDGSFREISIVRDVVEIDETFVRSAVVEKDGHKYGVIYVPKFYVNFENKDSREASSDLEKEINRLKEEGVEGLVIDLRNNGGGALSGAVKMSGLFIDQGPVVATKSRDGFPRMLNDQAVGMVWDGPMVVVINGLSASASEIFAGAMKDYNRAVIVGAPQTFGKGTVQNVVELDNMVRSKLFGDEKLGALKLTIEKFYRVNGAGNQLHGVASDVVMPDAVAVLDMGEGTEKYVMDWDSIPSAGYDRLDNDFTSVINSSRERVGKSPYFNVVKENIEWLKKRKEIKQVPLSMEEFRSDDKKYKQESKKFDQISQYSSPYNYVSPRYEIPMVEKDTVLASKRKSWHKDLKKDATLTESIDILSSMK